MLELPEVRTFLSLPQPVLTAYLDVNPARPVNRGPDPEYLTWLNAAGKDLAGRLEQGDQKLFREQLERVESFLRGRIAPLRGLVIFAGPATWEFVPLQIAVENELHWGRPSVWQLVRLLSRHKAYGVAVVDHAAARFFRYRLGDLSELEQKKFVINISNWRKKDMGKVSRKVGQVSLQKSRGADRDTFERRVEERYRQLHTETARHALQLCERHGLAALFLVGEARLIEPLAREFPNDFRPRVAMVEEDLGGIVSPALEGRLEPAIADWESAQESEHVTELLRTPRGAVLGIEKTLAELQRGRIRTLLVATGIDEEFRQCLGCGHADRSEDVVCPHCGSERKVVSLREGLPELAWKYNAEVEFVGDQASQRLAEAGGVGGWLRQPKSSARHATPRAG
ncbi:MAG: hypothetical protein KGL59_12530 [Acidobacteriota bacterium]|nr:hypothetical protein [Acidobacteriota bacterium]